MTGLFDMFDYFTWILVYRQSTSGTWPDPSFNHRAVVTSSQMGGANSRCMFVSGGENGNNLLSQFYRYIKLERNKQSVTIICIINNHNISLLLYLLIVLCLIIYYDF